MRQTDKGNFVRECCSSSFLYAVASLLKMSITLYSGCIVEWSSIIADAKCKRRAWRRGYKWRRGMGGWRKRRDVCIQPPSARTSSPSARPPSPFLSWGVIWERTRVICERTHMQEEDRDSRDREFIDEVRESVEWFTAVDIEVRHETHDDRLCMSSCAMC